MLHEREGVSGERHFDHLCEDEDEDEKRDVDQHHKTEEVELFVRRDERENYIQ